MSSFVRLEYISLSVALMPRGIILTIGHGLVVYGVVVWSLKLDALPSKPTQSSLIPVSRM
jgi:hypothetical protein